MKNLVAILLALLVISCNSKKEEFNEKSIRMTSEAAMNYIQTKDYESFKSLFPADILNTINDEQLKKVIDNSFDLINNYGKPTGDDIQHSISLRFVGNDSVYLHNVAYVFKNDNQNGNPYNYEILFSFIEKYGSNKIVGFNVNSKPLEAQNVKPTIPTLNKIKLNSEDVKLFRVYYDEGEKKTQFGNNKGVFALQGDNNSFMSSKLNIIVKDIFKELETAVLGEPEVFTTPLNRGINPEFIQAEFMMTDKNYGVFIYLPIKNGGTFSDCIIIRQQQFANLGYQYYLSKKQNQRLAALLESIKSKDWGKYYIQNP